MANEKRLIDANDLIEAINGLKKTDPYKKQRGLIERWVRNEGYDILLLLVKHFPTKVAVDVEQYETLREQYHDLRENFIDYVCSGSCNVAPYCLNRCEGCVDRVGWCSQGSDECHGFNPAEVILDGDGNA
jgi:hypothetical protein